MVNRYRTTRSSALLKAATALAILAVLALSWVAAAHIVPGGAARRAPVIQARTQAHLLTAEQAVALARATKKPVVASALTTPDSLTTASPDGLLTLTQTLEPTRVWQPGPGGTGQWVPLNASLVRAGSRLATTATTHPLSLSAGGAGPLAVLSNAGRTLALNWPSTLPAPVVSGATATYRSVLPGVDLVVTADTMGSFTTALIIKDATAAANPALRSLKISVSPTPGLRVTADAAGNLAVGAGGNAQPAFTADAARMWDSASSSAGTPLVTGSSTRNARSGLLAYSSATAPGIAAHIIRVPVSVSGDTITLAPPASALTGPSVVYPVNVEINNFSSPLGNDATNWAQVDTGVVNGIDTSTESFWDPSSDLQVGLCYPSPQCNGLLVERSFFTVPISSSLTGSNVVIFSSSILMNNEWAAACGQSDNQVNLYTTKAIDSSHKPTWNSTTTWWNNEITHQSFAFQNPKLGGTGGCPWNGTGVPDVTWDVTSTITADLKKVPSATSQTFGLRANDESSSSVDWHQFVSGAENITISTSYNLNPKVPSQLGATGGTVPVAACGTNSSPIGIGNDDVTLWAYEADADGDSMTTTVTVWDPADIHKTALLGSPFTLSPDHSKSTFVSTLISRSTLKSLHSSPFTYAWSATTTDQYHTYKVPTDAETSGTCYFNYNPNGPGAPQIKSWAYPPQTPACPGTSPCPITGLIPPPIAIGQSLTVTVGPPNGCNPTNNPCPTSYTYQLGAGQPATVTVSSSGSCTASACAMTFTMNQFGPVTLTVAGMANGNPGTAATASLQGAAPVPPYPDGYFSGGANPDLLAVGSGSQPSLWLYPGTGLGSLGYGIDIGSEGTGLNPGTDGPADWSNVTTTGTTIGTAQVAHGDFTRDGVQDVIAYYPPVGSKYGTHAGVGVLIPGPGIDAALQPESVNGATQIDPSHWTDSMFTVSNTTTTPLPISLVGAGNASESGATGGDDLVGVYGDSTDGYELAMWTAGPQSGGYGGFPYGTGEMIALSSVSTPTPDGSTWDHFSLATARPGGNAGATVLFALDNSNGQVWMSFNTGCTPTSPAAPCSTTGLIGTSGTWHLLHGLTLTNTSLASGDVNSGGTTELWAVNNGTATAYTVTYPTTSNNNIGSIALETSAVALTSPTANWPLADGADSGSCPSTTPTTATDDIGGLTANLSSGASWDSDNTFGCVLSLDGSSGQAQTSGQLLNTSGSYSVAAWVKLTSTANISVVVSQDGTNTSGFRLQFQSRSNAWQFIVANTDTTSPSQSYATGTAPGTTPTLGAWTYLVGVYDAGSKTATLYVNGLLAGSTGVSSTINATGPFHIGYGMYNAQQTYYWAGDLSQVQAWSAALTQAQVKVLYQHAR